MKENREDPAMLDRMLAQMAQETPEMPADFHARWTEKIRAEAAANQQTVKQNENRRQWRYILSAAAVFVFLIGGTLLTRSLDKGGQTNLAPGGGNTETVQTAGTVAADSAPEILEEAPAAEADMLAEPMMAMKENTEVMEESAEAAEEWADNAVNAALPETWAAKSTSPEAGKKAAESEETAAGGTDASMDAGALMEAEMYADMETEESEEAAMAGTAPAPEAAQAREEAVQEAFEPDSAEEKTEEEPAEEKPVEEKPAEKKPAEAEPAKESEFVSFLKDLGIFTLKTLAVAAAAAVLAFGAAGIHKAWKKRKNEKGSGAPE